jgi:hypothetical protein
MRILHRAQMTGFFLLIGFFAVAVGCGPNYKSRGIVKGQVVFFDKKLTAGTVAFTTQDGRVGSGNIDFNGNYTVTDAPLGSCTVTVTVPKLANMPTGGNVGPKPPGNNMPPMRPPGGPDTDDKPLIDPSKIVQIPVKYSKTDTSNITFTVEKGEQTYNITLTP